jgi:hypothetical protein
MPNRFLRLGIFVFPAIRDNFYKYSGALNLFLKSVTISTNIPVRCTCFCTRDNFYKYSGALHLFLPPVTISTNIPVRCTCFCHP